jgi:hypothetical protein
VITVKRRSELSQANRRRLILASICVEAVGISSILSGIYVEYLHGADLGYVLISIGSQMIAIGSLLWIKILRGRKS